MVFRHGIAEDVSQDGTDEARALTPKGVKRTCAAVRGLASLADPPEAILTSPLVRARQTAEIAAEAWDVEPEVMQELGAQVVPDIVAALSGRTEERVMIVGHEPSLGRTIAALCAGAGATTRDVVALGKAGCAGVSVTFAPPHPANGTLVWLATPRMLRALGARAAR
jgi:phosphohistidine phosphatase